MLLSQQIIKNVVCATVLTIMEDVYVLALAGSSSEGAKKKKAVVAQTPALNGFKKNLNM